MKSSTPQSKNASEIWLLSVLILLSALAAILAVKNIKISPDSMVYSLISQEILSGNGIRLPIVKLQDNLIPVNGTIPYPEGGTLLPVLFAAFGGVTPQNLFPAQLINVASHMAISIFTFLLMKKLYGNKGVALLTGTLVAISFPLLNVTHRVSTEPLFIALITASLYFLVLSRHSDQGRFHINIIIAGMCASATFLTRFPGIALAPGFFLEIYFSIKNNRTKAERFSAALAASLPLVTAGAIFIRNYILLGTLFGWTPPPFERSYLDAFVGTINMIFQQFPLDKGPVITIIMSVILFVLYMIASTKARTEFSKYVHSGLDLIIIFMVTYTALIVIATAKTQSVFELRFVSPLTPFLFILSVISIIFVCERLRCGSFSRLSLPCMILSLGIIAFVNCYKTCLRSGMFSYKQTIHYSIMDSPTYKWIKGNYGKNVIITSNKPYHLSFFGEYKTITIPHKRFDENYRLDNMESLLPDRMSKFGSRTLVLFEKIEEKYEGSYLAELFTRRKDNDRFILIRKFSDGVVYKLKE